MATDQDRSAGTWASRPPASSRTPSTAERLQAGQSKTTSHREYDADHKYYGPPSPAGDRHGYEGDEVDDDRRGRTGSRYSQEGSRGDSDVRRPPQRDVSDRDRYPRRDDLQDQDRRSYHRTAAEQDWTPRSPARTAGPSNDQYHNDDRSLPRERYRYQDMRRDGDGPDLQRHYMYDRERGHLNSYHSPEKFREPPAPFGREVRVVVPPGYSICLQRNSNVISESSGQAEDEEDEAPRSPRSAKKKRRTNNPEFDRVPASSISSNGRAMCPYKAQDDEPCKAKRGTLANLRSHFRDQHMTAKSKPFGIMPKWLAPLHPSKGQIRERKRPGSPARDDVRESKDESESVVELDNDEAEQGDRRTRRRVERDLVGDMEAPAHSADRGAAPLGNKAGDRVGTLAADPEASIVRSPPRVQRSTTIPTSSRATDAASVSAITEAQCVEEKAHDDSIQLSTPTKKQGRSEGEPPAHRETTSVNKSSKPNSTSTPPQKARQSRRGSPGSQSARSPPAYGKGNVKAGTGTSARHRSILNPGATGKH